MPVIATVGPLAPSAGVVPAFTPPFLPGPVTRVIDDPPKTLEGGYPSDTDNSVNKAGHPLARELETGHFGSNTAPNVFNPAKYGDIRIKQTPPILVGKTQDLLTAEALQAQIDRLVEAGIIKDTRDNKIEVTHPDEGSGDTKLHKASGWYPNGRPNGPPLPTSGDGSEFKNAPRLGQDEDAAAWPFGEGADDVDPKWGRTRDKLKKKKGEVCPWV